MKSNRLPRLMIISIKNSNRSELNKDPCSYRFKVISLFFLGLLSFLTQGQENQILGDSIAPIRENEFIEDHKNRFNVKLEVSDDVFSFAVLDNDIELELRPNLNIRYGVVLSYKFLSVRIAFRPGVTEKQKENKGDSNNFNMRIRLLFDNWNHHLEYGYVKGYYVTNTEDFFPNETGIHLQFPNLRSYLFTGSSSYKINKDYSLRAIRSQTEIQTKSAGSFMPGIGYSYYQLNGAKDMILPDGEEVERDVYTDFEGINLSLLIGYYYTYVIKKKWYINGFAVPGGGVEFYNRTFRNNEGINDKRHHTDYFLNIYYGAGAGYNGDKFFFGGNYNARFSNVELNSNKVTIIPNKHSFSVFFGYRFKAPKTVSRPIEYIEEKVPILKDED